jgi:glycosyltransferase involved in cell wall biosynthesis
MTRSRAARPATGAPARAQPQLYEPLRLLMTTDAVGGVWTYALALAGALAPLGVKTALAVLGPGPGLAETAEASAIPNLELVETGLPLDWTAREAQEVREAGAALAELARRHEADLIQLNSPALAAGTRFPAPVAGVCHSCVATWWAAVRGGAMPEDFRWRTEANRQGLVACHALVAPSAAFADATARAYELPRPLTVHNGRRPAPFVSTARLRQVFTAGRLWDEGKNIAALDAAAALIDAPLRAAGPLEGPNGARVALTTAEALGPLPSAQVRGCLAQAPIFASTARYEPFGLAVLEAAQAGCALVLSDIPTFRELWHGAAVFVPADDPSAIASVLQALLDAPDRTAALGAAARTRAGHYTLDVMAERMLGVYGVLLASRLPRRRSEAAA